MQWKISVNEWSANVWKQTKYTFSALQKPAEAAVALTRRGETDSHDQARTISWPLVIYTQYATLLARSLSLSLSLNLIQCSERWLKRLLPLLLSLVLLQCFSTVLTGQHYKVRICLIRQTDRQTECTAQHQHQTAPDRVADPVAPICLTHSLTHSHHFICSFVHLPLFIT